MEALLTAKPDEIEPFCAGLGFPQSEGRRGVVGRGGGWAAHTRTVGTGVSFDTSTKNPETGRTQSVGLVLTKSVRQGHSVDQALARQKSRS